MSQPKVLLLGPPGAGKGTQSSNIADEYGVDHVTTGDALRANKDMETDHGTPREYMEAGELVPDPVVNEIVKAATEAADGFALDGYPRNLSQAEYLDDITDLDLVALLEVDREELVDRSDALDAREQEIEAGEEDLADRRAAIKEREQSLDERAAELDRQEATLERYLPDQIEEVEEELASAVEGAVYSAMEGYVSAQGKETLS